MIMKALILLVIALFISSSTAANNDIVVPQVVKTTINGKNSLSITFNCDMKDVDNIYNYYIKGNYLYPDSAMSENDNHVLLFFSKNLYDILQECICINNCINVNDEPLRDTCVLISMMPIKRNDIIISELMYDINPPPNNLPAYDYFELHNKSQQDIDISNWTIDISGKQYAIPTGTMIKSEEYIVISQKKFFSTYETSNCAILPAFNLKIDGNISLISPDNETISFVEYSEDWHEEGKETGGWSLEIINIEYPCNTIDNWTSSKNANGGTPGEKNSVFSDSISDNVAPILENITIGEDCKTIVLSFSEATYFNTENIDIISIYPKMEIKNIYVSNHKNDEYTICLFTEIQHGTIYNLCITEPVYDCADNDTTLCSDFGVGNIPLAGDIIINEILFNSTATTNDYIELLNISDKVLDIENVRIGYSSDVDNITDLKFCESKTNRKLLMPNEFIVTTKDSSNLCATYPKSDKSTFIIIEDFPNLNNEEGYVCIIGDEIIDEMKYSSDMHFSFLKDEKGVSLERLSPFQPTQDRNNWHSAAETYNFGSPGIVNSQHTTTHTDEIGTMVIAPKIISPNNDGVDDYATIKYKFEEAGTVANVYIYNERGILLKHIYNNVHLPAEGTLTWDGTDEKGNRLNVGTYIIVIEAITSSRKKIKEKGIIIITK